MTILIADSGSTKTEWRLVKNEQIVAKVRTVGFNPYYADTTTIVAGLQQQLMPELPDLTPDSVYFYGSGCTGPTANQIVVDAINTVFPMVQTVDVATDMLGAARAACGHQSGIVCILGTGSNAAVYDGQSITSVSRSLGFWLGDEGSGAYLGRTLVVQLLHGLLPTELANAFGQQFTIDRLSVLDNAYHQPFPNRYFSQFTPFLSAHIDHPFVDALVSESFRAFLRLYVLPYHESEQESGAFQPVAEMSSLSTVAKKDDISATGWNAPRQSVHFVGSVAGYFQQQLRRVMAELQLPMGHILRTPIDELVRFHQTY